MNDHNFPIKVLRERIAAVTIALTQADADLATATSRRDKTSAALAALQQAVEVLREARDTDTPGVECSPADGEQLPERVLPKLLPGERLRFDIPARFPFEAGQRVVIQPGFDRNLDDVVVWVRVPGEERTEVKTLGVSGQRYVVPNKLLSAL